MVTLQSDGFLTATRKADRTKMANILARAAREEGGTAMIRDAYLDKRTVVIEIRCKDLRAAVYICGDGRTANSFMIPWYLELESKRRLSASFGLAQDGPVNSHHRAKCTTTALGFGDLVRKVRLGVAMAKTGEAWE